jgi:hypothetical protein
MKLLESYIGSPEAANRKTFAPEKIFFDVEEILQDGAASCSSSGPAS